MVWDVTVVHRLAASYINFANGVGACIADRAEEKKIAKYTDLIDNYFFQPIAFETLGGMGTSTQDFIKQLGKRIRERTGEPRSSHFLRMILSLAVQTGNAGCVLETIPLTPDELID